ncbi:MAG: orotidine-5'-phosphate decarboxylase [Bacteriovoracaceae bacterium]|jgi:orotidine-5'-phosphate decarboxylase
MSRNKIIPAFDVQTRSDLDNLIFELKGEATIVKIGMELYYTYGNEILHRLKNEGFKIFLDLKMHDIPSTVHNAAKTLAKNGVDILNVHAAGGVEMMKAALEGFQTENDKGILIGVTQLTSTSTEIMNNELLIPGSINDIVLKYAELTKKAGLHGIVCSAHEVKTVKENLGAGFKCITPGIRPKGVDKNDQKRVMTPAEAISIGSDYLVIGRAITKAPSPKEAFKNILKEIENE